MNTVVSVIVCLSPLAVAEALAVFAKRRAASAAEGAAGEGFALTPFHWALLAGFLAVIPAALAVTALTNLPFFAPAAIDSMPMLLLYNITASGLIEESLKFAALLALFKLLRKKPGYKAFLVVSFCAGLSFGCGESVVYLLGASQFALPRLFTAVLLHAACAGISAKTAYAVCAKAPQKELLSLVLAVLLHGLFNFFFAIGSFFIAFALVCLATSLIRFWLSLGEGGRQLDD